MTDPSDLKSPSLEKRTSAKWEMKGGIRSGKRIIVESLKRHESIKEKGRQKIGGGGKAQQIFRGDAEEIQSERGLMFGGGKKSEPTGEKGKQRPVGFNHRFKEGKEEEWKASQKHEGEEIRQRSKSLHEPWGGKEKTKNGRG